MACYCRRRKTWLTAESTISGEASKASSRGSRSCENAGVFLPNGDPERQSIRTGGGTAPKQFATRGLALVFVDVCDWTWSQDSQIVSTCSNSFISAWPVAVDCAINMSDPAGPLPPPSAPGSTARMPPSSSRRSRVHQLAVYQV